MQTTNRHPFMIRFLFAVCSLLCTVVLITGVFYIYLELQLPNVKTLQDAPLQQPMRIYSQDGQLMAEYGSQRRIPITLDQVPKRLIQAVLSVEDARFYDHPGVDLIALVRAAIAVISSGSKVQGASTITMQVARNFFLTPEKTYLRKIKEILLALKMDQNFTKNKILELYLNKIYFGNRAYGIVAAAQVYYGKPLQDLTLAQMAMLAGLPQAPSRNNPLSNPTEALNRRNHVLGRMLALGVIDPASYQQAVHAAITAQYHGEPVTVSADYVAERVRETMLARYGNSAYTRGLSVTTTIRPALQAAANRALSAGLIAYSKRHGYQGVAGHYPLDSNADDPPKQGASALTAMGQVNSLTPAIVLDTTGQTAQVRTTAGSIITLPWSGLSWARPMIGEENQLGPFPRQASDILAPGDLIWIDRVGGDWSLSHIPKVQGALVSMDPNTGDILALSGGFDYGLSHFNRAIQAWRQPGSNFKPFIYSAALKQGFTLASLVNDAPVVVPDSGENALWRPNNDNLKFYGPTRIREALAHSGNLVSIRLLQAIGIPYTVHYLQRFGFSPDQLPHTLSLALGAGSATPLQITTGYAVFANGGYYIPPRFITKITDYSQEPPNPTSRSETEGRANNDPSAPPTAAITPQNAYLITQALQSAIQRGTGRAAVTLHRQDLAGKTGTTLTDAWFSGFNSDIVTTVWVGFDDDQPLYEYGAQAALPIWIQYMRSALADLPEHSMAEPADMVTARIDPKTGMLARPGQPNAIFEIFRKEYKPSQFAAPLVSGTGPAATALVGSDRGEPHDAPLLW